MTTWCAISTGVPRWRQRSPSTSATASSRRPARSTGRRSPGGCSPTTAERRWLESLLLPLIFEEFTRWRDAQIAAGVPLLVHEAPTLFEAGVEGRYDAIVTITAPAEVREARRPGSAARMAAQLPEEEKARRSDYVYENTGDLEQLDAFVGRVMEALG